jgi:UDP-N-acetylmuramyl tripeptide synthase
MRLLDARRFTGPNLLSRQPLAIVDLAFDAGDDPVACIDAYRQEVTRMRAALEWPGQTDLIVRYHSRAGRVIGALCGFPESIDVLLAATELAEWAAMSAVERVGQRSALPLEPKRVELQAMLEAQRRPRIPALRAEAHRRGLPFLWDDEAISIGAGRRSRRYDWKTPPSPEEVPWNELGTIPIALITGTNGKTTCSRLLARVVREAGLVDGATSTEGLLINGHSIDDGDQTGPAAARTILRHPEVQVAVLETARGGLMRRGLAIESADAALITNVSGDHLGRDGIEDVPAMARVKAVIGAVVKAQGRVVLNALDPELVALAPSFPAPVTYFSGDPEAARDGWLVRVRGNVERPVLPIADVPLTFGGAAAYNIENALAVAAMADAFGLPEDALVKALRGFVAADNPGRGQLVEVHGVRVFLDFGHNTEGVRAVLQLVGSLRGGGRLAVITGSAGDRRDEDLTATVAEIVQARPDLVIVRELADYLRGRLPGEVPALMRQELLRIGMEQGAVQLAEDEVEALRRALAWARPGDFVALLVHVDEEGVRRLLGEHRP